MKRSRAPSTHKWFGSRWPESFDSVEKCGGFYSAVYLDFSASRAPIWFCFSPFTIVYAFNLYSLFMNFDHWVECILCCCCCCCHRLGHIRVRCLSTNFVNWSIRPCICIGLVREFVNENVNIESIFNRDTDQNQLWIPDAVLFNFHSNVRNSKFIICQSYWFTFDSPFCAMHFKSFEPHLNKGFAANIHQSWYVLI